MDNPWKKVVAIAMATLSPEELEHSAVYINQRLLRDGSTVLINRKTVAINAPSALVFVDLMPPANWGHPCRYLLINPDNGDVQTMAAEFPPDRDGLRIVHRGGKIEDWMLLTKERLE